MSSLNDRLGKLSNAFKGGACPGEAEMDREIFSPRTNFDFIRMANRWSGLSSTMSLWPL